MLEWFFMNSSVLIYHFISRTLATVISKASENLNWFLQSSWTGPSKAKRTYYRTYYTIGYSLHLLPSMKAPRSRKERLGIRINVSNSTGFAVNIMIVNSVGDIKICQKLGKASFEIHQRSVWETPLKPPTKGTKWISKKKCLFSLKRDKLVLVVLV